jgi:uncharacterized protein YndB with AHSA1/START domain
MTIKKQLTVRTSIEKAFRVFTANMSTWWPKDHHIGKSPLEECVVEPKFEGRWYERCEDGSECNWGKVLAWDPPHRLVLAWQLNAQFEYDPALITEVEVKFVALSPTETRVDFEHRNLERLGNADAVTGMDKGWGLILDRFAATAAS